MRLQIENPGKLAADQRVVFDRLSSRVVAEDADASYEALKASRHGKIISVDTARLLSPEFRSWSGRIRHTLSTGTPAGAYAHERLVRELRRPRAGPKRLLITAGGAGSGKTSQLNIQTDLAELVFDNQFKELSRARLVLREAIRNGWDTEVVYVHRPFEDVVRAVIERSQRTGRWNALAALPAAHSQAQNTIVSLWVEFSGRVNLHAIYNASEGVGRQRRGSRIRIKDLRQEGPYHVGRYEQAHSTIKSILDHSLAEGIVCREVAWIIAKGLDWRPKR